MNKLFRLGREKGIFRTSSLAFSIRNFTYAKRIIIGALLLVLVPLYEAAAQGRGDPSRQRDQQGVPGRVDIGPGGEQQEQTEGKTLTGQVVDKEGAGIAHAVVHLKNKKNLEVKTYISDEKGNYRFNGLDTETDYTVHAEHRGASSRPRTVSSFDDRKTVYLVLEVQNPK
ncbi:MAG: hypothetical protein A3F68_06370 [Acidobacteria bacterium RIFCSPLOWO2_12_FULL_54_10]|nr:MAG: hypothetical protein A3F68_06370 [Acidobacteria bacterium RIFCSPLOWO2_12_FULL_54_10]